MAPQAIIIVESDGVRVVALHEEHAPRWIAMADVHAATAFDDELWIVAGQPAQLGRYRLDGSPLDAQTTLVAVAAPVARSKLVRQAGQRAVVWYGKELQWWIADETSSLRQASLGQGPTVPDLALPISETRGLFATRDRVSLRDGSGTRWTTSPLPGAKFVDGVLVHDGKSAALVAELGNRHVLVLISLRDGAQQHRITLTDVRVVRLAARRGIALVLSGTRRMVFIDLRFGRVILDREELRDIDSVALDDAGQEVAIRYADQGQELVHVAVRDLAAEAQQVAAVEPSPVSASYHVHTSDVVMQADGAAPAPAMDDNRSNGVRRLELRSSPAIEHGALGGASVEQSLPEFSSLPRRDAVGAIEADELAALLDRQRAFVSSATGLAIAMGWDSGSISFSAVGKLPHRDEVHGLVGSSAGGVAEDELATAQQRYRDAERTLRFFEIALGQRQHPLTALANELGLSAAARAIIMVVAAPALWGEMAKLFTVLANDEARTTCDELLVCQILAEQFDRQTLSAEFESDSPLMQLGILRIGDDGYFRPFLPLTIDPVVLAALRGRSPMSELESDVSVVSEACGFAELQLGGDAHGRLIRELPRAAAPLRIAVRGRIGAGRHTLLATIAGATHRSLGVIDAARLIRSRRSPAARLRMLLQQTHLAGLVPCVDGLESLPADELGLRDDIREVLRRHPGALFVRLPWDSPTLLGPGHILVDLPTLSMTERALAWKRSVARHRLSVGDVDELADRYSVGPGVIERVCAQVAEAERVLPNRVADQTVALDTAVRQNLESRLGTTATRVHRLATWSQVILPADIQDSLTELIARIKHRRIVFDKWGFDRILSTARGVTALFQGGPGTGKTMVASAIANELGMDLYRVDLSRIMSKWIGETEQNLAKLFDAAEDGNAIILFDEADSLFAKRTEVKSSTDRYANLEVNYLLQRFDSFEGIAILTTNFGTSIDSAFKRRLSLRLTFPFPDDDMREKLWRAHLPPDVPVVGNFDVSEISRKYRLSGGYIRNCTLRAAFLAAEEASPLTLEHLERAIKAEFREIGKLGDTGVLE